MSLYAIDSYDRHHVNGWANLNLKKVSNGFLFGRE